MSIPKQVLKTIEAIKTAQSIPTRKVEKVLESLGFTWSAGEHQNWRHPDGKRYTLPFNPGPTVYGYYLKSLRNLLSEMEETTMAVQRFKNEELSSPALREALQSKSPPLLEKAQEETALQVVLQALRDIQKSATATQELLLEVAAKLDGVPVAKPVKTKLSGEELKQSRIAGLAKAREKRDNVALSKIKKALQENPKHKDNTRVLAALAGVVESTVKKYREKGAI